MRTLRCHCIQGLSLMAAALVCAEVSRVDCSLCTFLLVHASLAMASIEMLGSDAQRKELLPKMARLDLVGCWALTEPNHGSDASSISTTASKVVLLLSQSEHVLKGGRRVLAQWKETLDWEWNLCRYLDYLGSQFSDK